MKYNRERMKGHDIFLVKYKYHLNFSRKFISLLFASASNSDMNLMGIANPFLKKSFNDLPEIASFCKLCTAKYSLIKIQARNDIFVDLLMAQIMPEVYLSSVRRYLLY